MKIIKINHLKKIILYNNILITVIFIILIIIDLLFLQHHKLKYIILLVFILFIFYLLFLIKFLFNIILKFYNKLKNLYLLINQLVKNKKLLIDLYKRKSDELEIIIDNIPALIFYKDTKNNFIRVNKYIADAHKTTKDKLEGKSIFDIYPKEMALSYWNDDLEVINNDRPKINIIEEWDTDIGKRWVMTSKIPYKNSDNKIIGIIGISLDITDRKKMEDDLKKKNKELDNFVYIASHELQTPLRIIASLTNDILNNEKDNENIKNLNYILETTSNLQIFINDILNLTRIGYMNSKKSIINTEIALKKALLNLSSKIEENKAIIKYENLPELYGNENDFIHIFQNLISNAIKYRKSNDTPEIFITTEYIDNSYIFSVNDNGIGIDEKIINNIFEIYFKNNNIIDKKSYGIGLAICKKIIESYGGKIWVKSKLDIGSTFYFSIPAN